MSTTDEVHLAIRNLRSVVEKPTDGVDPFLLDIIRRSEATAQMSREEIERHLLPFGAEITKWGYQQLALAAEQYGVPAVVVVLPRTGDTDSTYRSELEFLARIGSEVGLTVVDLEKVYGPLSDRNNLKLAPWDWHPNAQGHGLLGRRIYEELADLGIMRFASTSTGNDPSGTTIVPETSRK